MMTKKEIMMERKMEELIDETRDSIVDALRDLSEEEIVHIACDYTDTTYYASLEDLLDDVCGSYLEAYELGQNSSADGYGSCAYYYDSWNSKIGERDIDDLFDFEELADDAIANENDYGCCEIEDILCDFMQRRDNIEEEVEEELRRQQEEYAKAIKLFGKETFKVYKLADADVINKITEAVCKVIKEEEIPFV